MQKDGNAYDIAEFALHVIELGSKNRKQTINRREDEDEKRTTAKTREKMNPDGAGPDGAGPDGPDVPRGRAERLFHSLWKIQKGKLAEMESELKRKDAE